MLHVDTLVEEMEYQHFIWDWEHYRALSKTLREEKEKRIYKFYDFMRTFFDIFF